MNAAESTDRKHCACLRALGRIQTSEPSLRKARNSSRHARLQLVVAAHAGIYEKYSTSSQDLHEIACPAMI
jgi:hypothetical protein